MTTPDRPDLSPRRRTFYSDPEGDQEHRGEGEGIDGSNALGGDVGRPLTQGDEPANRPAGEPEEEYYARGGVKRALAVSVEWIVVIVGALAVALIMRAFLFQAFYIPSESMEPTLVEHDRVIVNKLSYRLHDVNRGDLVVFRRPPSEPPTEIPELIKRVVALPGETIEGRDGVLYVDGRRLFEPYLAEGPSFGSFAPIVVPDDHVFVMGDNRNNSRDSRMFGPIDQDLILGRAFIRVWPLSRLGFL